MIPCYFTVAESSHEIQNPTSKEKLLLLGRRLGLGSGSRVLDIASGRGGPALLLAEAFGCHVRGIEIAPEFHAVAVERTEAAGLSDRLSFELGDGAAAGLEPASYDAALCLGASFVFGSLADTVDGTLHWQAVEDWLAANAADPGAPEIRVRHERSKRNYLRHQREYLGWAIFVGWKR